MSDIFLVLFLILRDCDRPQLEGPGARVAHLYDEGRGTYRLIRGDSGAENADEDLDGSADFPNYHRLMFQPLPRPPELMLLESRHR